MLGVMYLDYGSAVSWKFYFIFLFHVFHSAQPRFHSSGINKTVKLGIGYISENFEAVKTAENSVAHYKV